MSGLQIRVLLSWDCWTVQPGVARPVEQAMRSAALKSAALIVPGSYTRLVIWRLSRTKAWESPMLD